MVDQYNASMKFSNMLGSMLNMTVALTNTYAMASPNVIRSGMR